MSWYEAAAYAEFVGKSLPTIRGAVVNFIDRSLRLARSVRWRLAPLPAPSRPDVGHPFNFLPRVPVPVLMLNGRYDYTFPVESLQKPYFRWLGTPEQDKRHVLYDAAHDVRSIGQRS